MRAKRYTGDENVVIIGAPRSGTNVLRDFLCSAPGFATWPCDEINSTWRYGNARHSTDALTPDMATSQIRQYIRGRFHWVARRYDANVVVEKTCANSLRVPFVERVLEQPKYLFIYRDGVDVVQSAMRRWRAPLDFPYTLRKARFVPIKDLVIATIHNFGFFISIIQHGKAATDMGIFLLTCNQQVRYQACAFSSIRMYALERCCRGRAASWVDHAASRVGVSRR